MPALALDILAVRKRLGRDRWYPPQDYGPNGWSMVSRDLTWRLLIVESVNNGTTFVHATLDSFDRGVLPSLEQIQQLHAAIFGEDGHAAIQLTGPLQ